MMTRDSLGWRAAVPPMRSDSPEVRKQSKRSVPVKRRSPELIEKKTSELLRTLASPEFRCSMVRSKLAASSRCLLVWTPS
jgi:hypothetical protein